MCTITAAQKEEESYEFQRNIKFEPQHLVSAGCRSSGEPPSLPHSAAPPPAAAPGASPAALTSPAQTGSAKEIIITVAPTYRDLLRPIIRCYERKKLHKSRRRLQNHQASRIMCIFFFYLQLMYLSLHILLRQFNLYRRGY